jgi:hypothetical protein
MPDDLDRLDTLTDRLASDLAAVRWADTAQIRARARRRTRRKVLAAPIAVMLVLVGGWGVYSGLGGHRSGPAVHPTDPPVTASGTPGAGQIMSSGPPTGTPTAVTPTDPAWIPAEAMLRPEDVGDSYHLDNEYTYQPATQPTWAFPTRCPGFDDLHITAYERYRFTRGHIIVPDDDTGSPNGSIFVDTERYTAADAVQIITDIRRAVQTCARNTGSTEASSDARPAHSVTEWSITDSDFAGDQSLLIRQTVTSIEDSTGQQIGDVLVENYAAIRVGSLVTILQLSSENPGKLKPLAAKAAHRLCVAAVPHC